MEEKEGGALLLELPLPFFNAPPNQSSLTAHPFNLPFRTTPTYSQASFTLHTQAQEAAAAARQEGKDGLTGRIKKRQASASAHVPGAGATSASLLVPDDGEGGGRKAIVVPDAHV